MYTYMRDMRIHGGVQNYQHHELTGTLKLCDLIVLLELNILMSSELEKNMLATNANWHGPGTIPRNHLWTCSSWKGTSVQKKQQHFTNPQKNKKSWVSVSLNVHVQSAIPSFPGFFSCECQHQTRPRLVAWLKVRMSYKKSVTTHWIFHCLQDCPFLQRYIKIWILKVSGTYTVLYLVKSYHINSKTSETNSVHQGYPVIFYAPNSGDQQFFVNFASWESWK